MYVRGTKREGGCVGEAKSNDDDAFSSDVIKKRVYVAGIGQIPWVGRARVPTTVSLLQKSGHLYRVQTWQGA